MRNRLSLSSLLLVWCSFAFGQTQHATVLSSEPFKVAFCEIAKDPATYNHKLIEVTAFVTHGFEDFHLADPSCTKLSNHFSVWVMYGGKAPSNTVYCCPGEGGDQTRSKALTVEGMSIPLSDDAAFRDFTGLLKRESDTTVRVTMVGVFFSGEKQTINGSTVWGGAGHMGCCSLFVIEQIKTFEPHDKKDFDFTAEAGWYENEGCKYGTLQYKRHVSIAYFDGTAEQALAEQKIADSGQSWMFTDPQRVALESLKPFYGDQVLALRKVKETPARKVFLWKNGKQSVVIVLTRPYWLSFYTDSGSVAWIATTIKEAGCN
jgi:hypothetical protein